jgi:hypothetical protein
VKVLSRANLGIKEGGVQWLAKFNLRSPDSSVVEYLMEDSRGSGFESRSGLLHFLPYIICILHSSLISPSIQTQPRDTVQNRVHLANKVTIGGSVRHRPSYYLW